jgi:hypothetical protein
MVLEPIYEAEFSPYSFGFRPNRGTMEAIKAIRHYTNERMKFFGIIEGDRPPTSTRSTTACSSKYCGGVSRIVNSSIWSGHSSVPA